MAMDASECDVAKINGESLQLRNQQFVLGTVALAGSGLSAWLAPGLTAMIQGSITDSSLIFASVTWLILLFYLYWWSLGLKRMIAILSVYLKKRNYSAWESHFNAFEAQPERLYLSQTRFVSLAFSLYGIVAVSGSIAALCLASEKIILKWHGIATLATALVVYLILLWGLRFHVGRREKKIDAAWERVLLSPAREEPPSA